MVALLPAWMSAMGYVLVCVFSLDPPARFSLDPPARLFCQDGVNCVFYQNPYSLQLGLSLYFRAVVQTIRGRRFHFDSPATAQLTWTLGLPMDSNTLFAAVDIYDALMLAVIIIATVWGSYKGMAWQVTSLAAIVVSGIVAIRFSAALAPMISDNEPWNRFIAMFVLYLLTSFTIWILFRFVAGFIDRVKLKEFDHQMGALFGLAKGVLFCVIITFFAVTLSENLRQTVLGSFSGRAIAVLTKNAAPVLPEEVTDVLGKYIEELDRRLDPDEPSEGGVIDRLPFDRDPLEPADPNKIIDEIRSDVREGIDKNLNKLDGQAGDKLDDAQKDLGNKASELREALKDRFDLDNR